MLNDVDSAHLRRLASLRPDGARVLSLYLDLDPAEFGTIPARETEITSALDMAARVIEESDLGHDALAAARADVERAREALADGGLDATGARAVALFACGPEGLFEVLKLPRPIATHVIVDSTPWIEPLIGVAGEPRVAVALVDRNEMRLFHGTADALEELPAEDSIHLREHRSASGDEASAHYRDVAEKLLTLLKTRGFDVLVLGARAEERGEIAGRLHPYVSERLAGDIDVDRSSATVDDVRREAAAVVGALQERKAGEALGRLREGLGRGERAAGGVDDVLTALNQRRVEILLYERGRAIPGAVCPQDGWLGAGVESCPVDGTAVEQRDSIVESAAEAAILQDAEVLSLDAFEHPELGPHGGIAAVLRF